MTGVNIRSVGGGARPAYGNQRIARTAAVPGRIHRALIGGQIRITGSAAPVPHVEFQGYLLTTTLQRDRITVDRVVAGSRDRHPRELRPAGGEGQGYHQATAQPPAVHGLHRFSPPHTRCTAGGWGQTSNLSRYSCRKARGDSTPLDPRPTSRAVCLLNITTLVVRRDRSVGRGDQAQLSRRSTKVGR